MNKKLFVMLVVILVIAVMTIPTIVQSADEVICKRDNRYPSNILRMHYPSRGAYTMVCGW